MPAAAAPGNRSRPSQSGIWLQRPARYRCARFPNTVPHPTTEPNGASPFRRRRDRPRASGHCGVHAALQVRCGWRYTSGLDSLPCTLLSIEINGRIQSDAENGTACRTVRGEADVIWDAHPAIRTGRMPVSRYDRRDRSGDIRREQFVAAALAHRIEIVIASLLQNVLQRTRYGTRFGFIFQNLRKFKSIAIGNIDSSQLAHIRPPI